MTTGQSDAFVFFGATGDLAYKQIFPALHAMIRRGRLDVPVIGVAKSGWSLEQLQARARDSVEKHGTLEPEAFRRLASLLSYIDGDYRDARTYERLRQTLGDARRPLHYLAIPPSMFASVTRGLARSGCANEASVIVEKPFGRDLASARALNRTLHEVFPESAIRRIDHFLGKEAVQNLLYFRFANTFLEPIWNRNYISSVHMTMAEAFGVKGRGRFYEEVGAIRDVVQNHMFQVLTLLAMDAPVNRDVETFRDEKNRLLKAVRSLTVSDVVRGQFRGYRDEEGVAPGSGVETFAALRLHIDTWRWAGVPFYIRAGKQLPVTATDVVVELKHPPQQVFDDVANHSNCLRFRLDPDVFIAIGARVKASGEAMRGEDVDLIAHHHPGEEMEPYERLFGDAMRGEGALFAREDGVEAAWRVVDPILDDRTSLFEYAPQSWGPGEADRLITGGGGWHDPAGIPV